MLFDKKNLLFGYVKIKEKIKYVVIVKCFY